MRRWKPLREPLWRELPDGGFHPFELRAMKGEMLHRVGDFDGLERLCHEDLVKDGGDIGTAGYCLMKLGMLAAQRGDGETGRDKLTKALEIFHRTGDAKKDFTCRCALVNISLMERRFSEAEAAAVELAAETQDSDDHLGLSAVLNLQGFAAMGLGQWERALFFFGRKLELARRHGLLFDQATALGNLGRLYHETNRFAESEAAINGSLAIVRALGDPFTEYYLVYMLAESYEAQGKYGEAERCYYEDLKFAKQLGDGPGEKTILDDIARIEKNLAAS